MGVLPEDGGPNSVPYSLKLYGPISAPPTRPGTLRPLESGKIARPQSSELTTPEETANAKPLPGMTPVAHLVCPFPSASGKYQNPPGEEHYVLG